MFPLVVGMPGRVLEAPLPGVGSIPAGRIPGGCVTNPPRILGLGEDDVKCDAVTRRH